MSENWIMFIGTYTRKEWHVDGKADGIYSYSVDSQTGDIHLLDTAREVINPSFLAISPNRKMLYTVSETDIQFSNSGAVAAYSFNPADGSLTFRNILPSQGTFPCQLSVEGREDYLFVANYSSGTLAMFPLSREGDILEASCTIQHKGKGKNPLRQEGPHVHSATATPDGNRLIAANLGIDRLFLYDIDRNAARLSERGGLSLTPGSGPRHVVIHPCGAWGAVINELSASVTTFFYDAKDGRMEAIATVSALPDDFEGESICADIHFSREGDLLYCSNRGHDSITVFQVFPSTGTLKPVAWESTRGRTPRNFALSPDGKFLFAANQDSDTICRYRISPDEKFLIYERSFSVPTPVCLLFAS